MILYHTSDTEIKDPDIFHGRKNADFGQGFYLTPDKDFAYRWAKKDAVVNIYEFKETGLDIETFKRSKEWFDYIFNNRRAKDSLKKDVIIGPIANDTIFETLGVLSSGFIKPEDAMKLLKVGPEYKQVAIKTEKAKKNLRFIESKKIEKLNDEIKQKEQDEYLEALSKELEKIMD